MSVIGDLLTSTLAGLAFIPCAMASVSSTPSPQTRRREVVVNGKRVKTIDVHAHCIVPAAAAVINHPLEAPGLLMHDTSTRIAAMDAQGIDVEALSINPYWYRADPRRGRRADQDPERDAGAILRRQPRPLRRLRDRRAATPRPGRRTGRTRGQATRLPRRRRRRQRRRRGTGQSRIPPLLGQVRGTRRPRLHAPARHARTGALRPARAAAAC